ncbi:hypothetical protein TNCV_1968261 [Trichonephila clavipes]|nr:hypothetical protein TNCV_1968261 [Trichonephila clavipes]
MTSSGKEQKVQDRKCNRYFKIWWIEKHGIISKGAKRATKNVRRKLHAALEFDIPALDNHIWPSDGNLPILRPNIADGKM